MSSNNASPSSLEKLFGKIKSSKAREYPTWPSSETGGVMPMSIESRFANERERLGPDFNHKWRKWRAQYLKDQELHPQEPFKVPELYKELNNPIRRFYKAPWNYFEEKLLAPKIGAYKASVVRNLITKSLLVYAWVLVGAYHLKYNHVTWDVNARWDINTSKIAVYPGDPRYPSFNEKPEKWMHCDRGFNSRKVLLFKEDSK